MEYTTTESWEGQGVEEAGCKIYSGAQTVSQIIKVDTIRRLHFNRRVDRTTDPSSNLSILRLAQSTMPGQGLNRLRVEKLQKEKKKFNCHCLGPSVSHARVCVILAVDNSLQRN